MQFDKLSQTENATNDIKHSMCHSLYSDFSAIFKHTSTCPSRNDRRGHFSGNDSSTESGLASVNTKLLKNNLFAHYIDSSPLLIYDFVAVTQDVPNVHDLSMRSCNLVHISGRLDILGETDVLVHREKSNVGNLQTMLALNMEH